MNKVSVAKVLECIKDEAYITITHDLTGELLYHGVRKDKASDHYLSTTLLEPYVLIGLNNRYGYTKDGNLQLIVSLYVATPEELKKMEEELNAMPLDTLKD